MILIFECPYCGRENEQNVDLECDMDYIADDEECFIVIECQGCEHHLKANIALEIKKLKGE